MKIRIVTACILIGALMGPVAAQAQVIAGTIIGGAVGGPVGAAAGAVIGLLNMAGFANYVAKNAYPSHEYIGDVVIGVELPEGTSYYQVPGDFYRSDAPAFYTVLNGRTVLIDPSTRKVVHVFN